MIKGYIFIFLIVLGFSALSFAADETVIAKINSGIQWNPNWTTATCLKQHNIRRECYAKKISPEILEERGWDGGYFKPTSCYQGNMEDHNTIATMVECKFVHDVNDPLAYNCGESISKFYNPDEVCNIPSTEWNQKVDYGCYGDDLIAIRTNRCPSGCADVPKYHVCDWTPQQYEDYKNCTSVSLLNQQTRESLCPTGMPDVDEQGPPPRISFLQDRVPHKQNYLTYEAPNDNSDPLKIEIASVAGENLPTYCFKKITDPADVSCTTFVSVTESMKVEDSKYVITKEDLSADSRYVLVVKNSLDKTSTIYFDTALAATGTTPIPQQNIVGKWVELFGPDLSPILAAGSNNSEFYQTNACGNTQYPIYQEEKDISGRRWKCIPADLEPLQPGNGANGGNQTPVTFPNHPTVNCNMVYIDMCVYKISHPNVIMKHARISCGCGPQLASFLTNKGLSPYTETVNGCYEEWSTGNAIPDEDYKHCDKDPTTGQYSAQHAPPQTTQPQGNAWENYTPTGNIVHFDGEWNHNLGIVTGSEYGPFKNYYHTQRYLNYCSWLDNSQGIDNCPGSGQEPAGGTGSPCEDCGSASQYYNGTVYNYTGYLLDNTNIGCETFQKCNSYGVRYDLMVCNGGASPAADPQVPDKWTPFVFPGQFIHYPDQSEACNPDDEQWQTTTTTNTLADPSATDPGSEYIPLGPNGLPVTN